MSHYLKITLRKREILHAFITPYYPQKNSIVERFNSTIMTAVRCALKHSDLDHRYWTFAARGAVFKHNLIPHSATGKRPAHTWHTRSIVFQQLYPFGCHGFALIPVATGSKLQPAANLVRILAHTDKKHIMVLDMCSYKISRIRVVEFLPQNIHFGPIRNNS